MALTAYLDGRRLRASVAAAVRWVGGPLFDRMAAKTAGWSRAKNLKDSPVQLLYNFTIRGRGHETAVVRDAVATPDEESTSGLGA